jgi:hypothetical protein
VGPSLFWFLLTLLCFFFFFSFCFHFFFFFTFFFCSQLRKRYYGGGGDSWGNVPRMARMLGISNLWDLIVPAGADIARLEPSDAEAARFLAPAFQEVIGPDGDKLDIGHALVGLESCRSPQASRTFRVGLGLRYGPPTATWGGDAGTALTGHVAPSNAARRSANRGAALRKSFNEASSPADMRGNADAYALHGMWQKRPHKSLFEVLEAYYAEGSESVCARARYSGFASVAGFLNSAGQLTSAKREAISDTIYDNARAPMIKSGQGVTGKLSAFVGRMPWTSSEFSTVVNLFINHGFHLGVRRETSGSSFAAVTGPHFAAGTCAHFES